MKTNNLRLWSVTLFSLIWLLALTPSAVSAARPNIILIFIDDLGWNDIGCYGNSFVDTPRIDRLAAEGIRFTDFYAAGTVCSPTRCAVQSGQNQARIGITDFISGHWRPFERVITPRPTMALPLDIVTIAESMKAADYATGYIGKWHLGNGPAYQPQHQGYDFAAVIGGPHLPGQFRVQGKPNLKPKSDQYRTDFEADLSIQFIKENKDRPFFLMLSPYAVHIPLGAMSHKVAKYRSKAKDTGRELPHPVYAAMIEHCDDMVGRIVDTVESEGLTQKTMIVFTSDNGGLYRRYDYTPEADDTVTDLSPLRGEKGNLYEGGVRVPLIVKFPPMTKAGSISAEPTISYDFYPTFVRLAGGSLPANQSIDGQDLSPLLKDPNAKLDREAIHWHYPHYHHGRPASSIRARNWKLIEYLDQSGDVELYHLGDDISETMNLAKTQPAKAASLKRQLGVWRQQVIATMPIPNPSYDPNRAREWWSTRTGKPVPSKTRKRYPPTEKGL
jgi:arylsulfatase A